ncbi:carbon-nitrogen hydrolase [Helicobacter monodelphidis]|uniref:carbon-nitrogen hydrolase n=1 Tax=Helicobacter sp. 15-1451 TaxID=2004995 RepID=UPI000DCC2A74|nr:carbon-nitrogen hydrolase [Helicobacter sp. 15-1451]RAX58417.1 carbon-nitrogen hydrolase [Helicobacter sp. 15-1451]
MDKLPIALIQQCFSGDKESMIESTLKAIRIASKEARLVVLQELHCTEYFCQSENPAFCDYAIDFKKDVQIFSQCAKECNVVLVGSFFEERAIGLYHNTAVVFEQDGRIAGKYRKMHIPDDPAFYEKFYFTPGDLGFTPIQTSVGKLGVLVCWDQWFPEAARLMTLGGAECLIYPTAIGYFAQDSEEEQRRQKEAWVAVQRGHAIANGIPVMACNRVGFEKDTSGFLDGIHFWGNSFVFGPQGELLGELGEEEGILYVCLDRQRLHEVRRMWPFLRDRRIDAYAGLTQRFLDSQ